MSIFKVYITVKNFSFLMFGVLIGFTGGYILNNYFKINKKYEVENFIGKPIFEVDGMTWTTTSLPRSSQIEYSNLESNIYNAKKSFYEQVALKIALSNDISKSKNYDEVLSLIELLKIHSLSDNDTKKYYEEAIRKFGNGVFAGQSYDKLKSQLKFQLMNQKASEIAATKLNDYIFHKRIKILLDDPEEPPIRFDLSLFPARGNLRSNMTLVNIFDYEDPQSVIVNSQIENILRNFSAQIKFVNIVYPSSLNGMGAALAKGAFCAQKIGVQQYWEYHTQITRVSTLKLFKTDNNIISENFNEKVLEIAKKAQINSPDFLDCLKSDKANQYIFDLRNHLLSPLGIQVKPSIYFNRKLVRSSLVELESSLKSQWH